MSCSRTCRWKRGLLGALLLGLPALFFTAFLGCSNEPTVQEQGKKRQSGSERTDFLPSVIAMLQPNRLGRDTSAEQAAGLLNRWLESQGALPGVVSAADKKQIAEQLPAEVLADIERDRFNEQDAEHFRNARLYRQIVAAVAQGESDKYQVVALFDWVSTNIELISADAPPMTPHEILMFGQGTAADRAWIFAGLVRQMRLEAYILRPSGAADGPVLVGVLLDDAMYLFDPQLGLPVPAAEQPADELLPVAPATLADVSDDPGLWTGLWPEGAAILPGPQTTWQAAGIGTGSLWSARMKLLESSLRSEEMAAVVYQPLPIGAAAPRLKSISGGRQLIEAVELWPYPEQQLARRRQASPSVYEALWQPFRAPYPKAVIDRNLVFGQPQWLQWQRRTEQLIGEFSSAVQGYLSVRLASTDIDKFIGVPPEITRLHRTAAEDAFFWTGVCQLADRHPNHLTDAARTFDSYLGRYAQSGRHVEQARLLLARCLAAENRHIDAVQHLKNIPATSPNAPRATWLVKQWSDSAEPTITSDGPAVAEKVPRS